MENEEIKYYGCIVKRDGIEGLAPDVLEMCYGRTIAQIKPGLIRLFKKDDFEEFLEKLSMRNQGPILKRYICGSAFEVEDSESLLAALWSIIGMRRPILSDKAELTLRFMVYEDVIDVTTVMIDDPMPELE